MILRTRGKVSNLNNSVVAKVSRRKSKCDSENCVLLTDTIPNNSSNLIILTTATEIPSDFKGVYGCQQIDHLDEDDIVHIETNGSIRTIYRVNSSHNIIFATERCNSNCLMCSQPPMDRDDIQYLHDIHLKMIPLIPKDCPELCITGGEPTILGETFFELLAKLKHELPNTEIHILSNGRSFAYNSLAERLSQLNYPQVMIGIPLYSDYYQTHDHIVQSKHAFYQTMMGIHNLKRYNIRVEIRVVLHKLVIPRLNTLAKYIYKNLSFVDHVAFMGLEVTGYTKANLEELWIDPTGYMEELSGAVTYLSAKKLHVSIYNTPLCLMPEKIWPWSRNSISDWKNVYMEECTNCKVLNKCGGLFATSGNKISENIKAFAEAPMVELG